MAFGIWKYDKGRAIFAYIFPQAKGSSHYNIDVCKSIYTIATPLNIHNMVGIVHDTIPTVDISAFTSDDATAEDKANVVEAMRYACTTYGFFYLIGHGVSEEDRNKALDCARLFFSLSHEEKMDVWIGKCMGRSFRGFEPGNLQTHQKGLLPDTKQVSGIS